MKSVKFIVFAVVLCTAAPAMSASRESMIAEGERALMAGNAIVAERAFVIGMNTYPDDPRFPFYAGVAAFYLDRPGDAKRRLVIARPNYPRAGFFLGMIELEAGNPEAALREFDEYLKRVPRDPEGELLKGIAMLGMSDPNAVRHFNLAAQLKKSLRTQALFFRGLSQFEQNQTKGADKALRAVMRLGDQPAMLELAELTLDALQNRGDIAKEQWAEAYIDVVYDDNLNRDLDSNPKIDGIRTLLRGRYWKKLQSSKPVMIAGAWLEHDQPIANDASARTAIGGIFDLGVYKGLENVSIDPGIEAEPSLGLFDGGAGYALNELAVAVRPRIYIFQDHERSTKLFYEFKYVSDFDEGFFSGPRHVVGARPSWTGRNRRTYLSGLVALQADSTDTAAYRSLGPKVTFDAQASLKNGLLTEFSALYHKAFYRDVAPRRQEDRLLGHFGIGWWKPEKKFMLLAGTDQELRLSSEADRSWKARSYWLRLGAYL